MQRSTSRQDGTEIDERTRGRRDRQTIAIRHVLGTQVPGTVNDHVLQRKPTSGAADLDHERSVAVQAPAFDRGAVGDRRSATRGEHGGRSFSAGVNAAAAWR